MPLKLPLHNQKKYMGIHYWQKTILIGIEAFYCGKIAWFENFPRYLVADAAFVHKLVKEE